ncbi:hypothetical protein EW026_g5652 [Hermanssonia centrifuga]|uniref:DUF6532 domain-containing protein n=1 Tax=Hermanssonia centrifuga TaxID=98765 RepID=A0A4S4KDN2_9APHY|nr:hypothetical protein EW026_g5652 [Hermanssonia centrifuga]
MVVKEVIKVAIDLYEVQLLTADTFPSASLENEWVTAVWADACQHEGVKYRITPDLHKMLTRQGTHLHSKLKIKGHKTVTMYYNLKAGQSASAKDKNKKLVAKLLQDTGADHILFLYLAKEQAREAVMRQHIYRHPAIGNLINEYIFGDQNSLGVRYTEHLGNQLLKATIALASTCIEFCLKEWAEGHFDDTTFTVSENSVIFASHLADLDRFERLTIPHNLYRKLAAKLLANARYYASLGDLTDLAPTAGRMREQATDMNDNPLKH